MTEITPIMAEAIADELFKALHQCAVSLWIKRKSRITDNRPEFKLKAEIIYGDRITYWNLNEQLPDTFFGQRQFANLSLSIPIQSLSFGLNATSIRDRTVKALNDILRTIPASLEFARTNSRDDIVQYIQQVSLEDFPSATFIFKVKAGQFESELNTYLSFADFLSPDATDKIMAAAERLKQNPNRGYHFL